MYGLLFYILTSGEGSNMTHRKLCFYDLRRITLN